MVSKLIIDFKPISPLHGDLFGGKNPSDVAVSLEKAGVLGLSVVTESEHFGGSLQLLRDIAKVTNLPILRKDFIKTDDNLKMTADNGAKYVLLIAATCPQIAKLHESALAMGLKPLVEVHTLKEMRLAKEIGAKIVGINNKDILNLERDNGTVARTRSLISHAPEGAFLVSESGIKTPKEAEKALKSGAHAVLVGTAFWRGQFDGILWG
jgi:indole-3-glycerol phosphate synthase